MGIITKTTQGPEPPVHREDGTSSKARASVARNLPNAMSANYWESTQRRHWLFTKEQLASMRQKLEDDNAELVRLFPLPQIRHLFIYFNQRASLYFSSVSHSRRFVVLTRHQRSSG